MNVMPTLMFIPMLLSCIKTCNIAVKKVSLCKNVKISEKCKKSIAEKKYCASMELNLGME